MNLFNKHLKSYITASLTVAVIYAFVVGFNLPMAICFADGASFGILFFSTNIVLWNILRFAKPAGYQPTFHCIFIFVVLFATSAIVTGIETLVIYLSFPSFFNAFVPTIPLRAFITLLLFFIGYFLFEIIANNLIKQDAGCRKMSTDPPLSTDADNSLSGSTSNVSAKEPIDRITVRSGQKIKIIPVDSILYIKADGDYVSIRTAEGSWLKEQTMKYTEDRLPISDFARIHRSYIVNIRRISRIERYGEKRQVVLSNNEKIIISAARYHTLKQILGI